ncbi:Polyphosphate kinase [Crateriforma conspicua]|uniref:Polyphosphate kinase n=1 Tax=Crateriforma conspicua TaxID=2527996 RepID=A0A5C6FSF9_9PLAN|nr:MULTISPECIES: polyphosphate kinase 1 [Crateriforma]TWU65174.1 Polyphosphate kinase [Crateriforma conspicua]
MSASTPRTSKTSKATKKSTKSESKLPVDRFVNRELGWLEFNARVLDQATDPDVPLLERAKFLAITGSNLDEFVMVRVGGLKLQYERNSLSRDPAGMTVSEQLQAVLTRCHLLVGRQGAHFREQLEPELVENGIHRVDLSNCSESTRQDAHRTFVADVLPVLTPHAVFHDRPFPMLQGLSMHLCVRLDGQDPGLGKPVVGPDGETPLWHFAIIPLGRALPRIIQLPSDDGYAYVLLEDLVAHFAAEFFQGRRVLEATPFRITRNADIELREDGAGDLLEGMEEVLEGRRQSDVVRLELAATAGDEMTAFLTETMGVQQRDTFRIDGPLDLTYLFGLSGIKGFGKLKDVPWPPQGTPGIDPANSMFATMGEGDWLLVHPYERFDPVVRLLEEAAGDPDVLAIKQILYRTSKNSPIVAALMKAAQNGKYVSAIVELKARFDEARNIEWAREMEQAGVQVIYGIRGLKTHAKVCVVVRREPEGIRRYIHFGTGNYNEATAKLYSDVSLLTCDEVLGDDATAFFNAVTGASQPQPFELLAAAPLTLRQKVITLIDAETRRAVQGDQAEIIVKLNALVDTEVIDALYRANRAGVKVLLNIRGVCCLKPGIAGLSENIRVVSVVDRYLEHARILYFRHGGDGQLFISSADWMPRNLDRRVELLVPVLDPACREKLFDTLQTYFQDDTNAWVMQPNGQYIRTVPEDPDSAFRSQQRLYEDAVARMKASTDLSRGQFDTQVPRKD